MRTRNRRSLGVGLAALIVGVASGFLSWFQLTAVFVELDPGFTLVTDSYNAVYVYATQGTYQLNAVNSLGNLLVYFASANPVVVVAFAFVLFFWPAMIVSGLVNEVGKTIRWLPALWGIIAFVSAYVMMAVAKQSVGVGAWLDLCAAALFVLSFFVAKKVTGVPAPPSPAGPSVP